MAHPSGNCLPCLTPRQSLYLHDGAGECAADLPYSVQRNCGKRLGHSVTPISGFPVSPSFLPSSSTGAPTETLEMETQRHSRPQKLRNGDTSRDKDTQRDRCEIGDAYKWAELYSYKQRNIDAHRQKHRCTWAYTRYKHTDGDLLPPTRPHLPQ